MRPVSRRHPFLSQDADRSRLPVAIVSGFLGSGKTTLVNALLRDGRMAGTAVAVNEFGEIPLDGDLIDHGADKVVVMANGCLCCNLAGDIEDSVMRLFSRRASGQVPRFERLIVEPSGLSDPAPIAQAILRNPLMSRDLRLAVIITAVDALFAATQLARHPETRKQIALADRIVLTKTDVAPAIAADQLRADLRAVNPVAPILTAPNGNIDPTVLFPPHFLDQAADPGPARSALFADAVDADHLRRIASVSLTAEQPLRWRAFDDWLRRIRITHAQALLRIKGMLHIEGVDGPVVVQGIHHVLNAPVVLDAWPSGAPQQSRLVLIADPDTVAAARQSWADALPGLVRY